MKRSGLFSRTLFHLPWGRYLQFTSLQVQFSSSNRWVRLGCCASLADAVICGRRRRIGPWTRSRSGARCPKFIENDGKAQFSLH